MKKKTSEQALRSILMQEMARAAADQAADYAVRATKEYIEKLNAELAMLRERLARSETAREAELRAELARVTEERDALLAERERMAPVVAAARAYAKACEAAREATRAAFESFWLCSPWSSDKGERVTLAALAEAARAMHTEGDAK